MAIRRKAIPLLSYLQNASGAKRECEPSADSCAAIVWLRLLIGHSIEKVEPDEMQRRYTDILTRSA